MTNHAKTRTGLVAATAIFLVAALAMFNLAQPSASTAAAHKGDAVQTTVPRTPSVGNYRGEKQGRTRVFKLTALQFTQQIATFPIKTATVWGWKVTGKPDTTASTPGPTLVAYEGEKIRFVVTNDLPEPTSLHPHGTHQPNSADGVAGIDFTPIQPGETRRYAAYKPDHAGTFAYHSHTNIQVQDPRGLVGLITVLPRRTAAAQNPDVDVAMTLQNFNPSNDEGLTIAEGGMAATMPDDRGMWPFSTINGKTGDASGKPITIKRGDLVQIRLYNASSMSHSMHLHGADMTLVDINGHKATPMKVTTKAIAPGEFFTLQFRASNQGNWVFHCSFPDHQANASKSGYQGAPVGMTRIFHYKGAQPVPEEYFGPPTS